MSGISVESDMRLDCAGGTGDFTGIIAAASVTGHISAGVTVECAVDKAAILEGVVPADGVIAHSSSRIAKEGVCGISAADKDVVSADGMVEYVPSCIAEKKVRRIRDANQNVIGAHLMINQITRSNRRPLTLVPPGTGKLYPPTFKVYMQNSM
jgi:hypothetical protein